MKYNKEEKLIKKGDFFWAKYNFEKALYYYKKALKINPNNVDVLTSMGSILNELERYDEAITLYHKAFEIKPNDEVVRCDIQVIYLNKYALVFYYNEGKKEIGYPHWWKNIPLTDC